MSRLSLMLAALLLAGLLYRLWPVVAGMPSLGYFFITEDGYLMLTVARNLAIGLGMSVSDGAIQTNGVQPLATFLFAVPYLATGGDKVAGLVGIHLIHAATALAVVFALRAFAARILAPRDTSLVWPWVAGLLWYLGPVPLRHSMNGLETSLYALVVLLTLLVFARVLAAGDAATPAARLGLGAMCGIAVLARNDAVFLVASIFAVWAAWELFAARSGFGAMLVRLVPPGLLSIAVASPWLISNKLKFGSIVPVSGTAQGLGAGFGGNAPLLPAKLFEQAFPMLPIPGGIEAEGWVAAVASSALAMALALFLWRVLWHAAPAWRAVVLAYLGFVGALAFYYGFVFGAAWFLSRYLTPAAPLLIVAGLAAVLEAGRWIRTEALAWVYAGAGIVLSLALLVRASLPGVTLEGHEQVVAWVQDSVPDEVWVAAVQTGTLGYWHDRTYNLDGKVNPAALQERLTKGHVLDYVAASEIDYVVDWAGVGGWIDAPEAQSGFAEAFELVLRDDAANLSVMRRKEPRYRP